MQMSHLTVFVVPIRILGFDGDDTTFHVVNVVFILAQGQANDSHINLAVDTLGVKTFFQDDTRLVTYLDGLFYRLGDRLDRLMLSHLLRCVHMTHQHAEQGEGNPKQCQTEEDDAHSHQRHAKAVGVFALELLNLRLADCGHVRDSWRHAVG